MSISFTDHLHDASSETLLASSAILSPRSIGTPKDLTFKFIVSINIEYLERQAEAFVDSIRGNHTFSQALDRFISLPFVERDESIKNVYIYSYFKVISAMEDLLEAGFNYYGAVPTNSLIFFGHKMLFYTFLNYNIFNPALDMTSNVYMTRTLELDVDSFKDMKDHPVWQESYNANYPGGLFNRTYERILSAFLEITEVEVSTLSSQDDIPMDSRAFSLGSAAYTNKLKPNFFSTMEDSIATVSTRDSITDHNSKFWNTACCISLFELPNEYSRPDFGSPYTYVRNSMVSPNTVFAEVESITGLKADGRYSNYGQMVPGIGKSPMSPDPSSGGPNPNSGNGTNNPINGGNGPNFNPKGPTNSRGPNNNKKQNRKVTGFIKRKADQLGRALTSDEVKAFLKEATLSLIGNEMSKRRQQDLIENLQNSGYVENTRSASVNTPVLHLKWENKNGRTRKNE
jgi:hypothetical protein